MIDIFIAGSMEPFRIVQKEQKLQGQSIFKISIYFVYFQLAR